MRVASVFIFSLIVLQSACAQESNSHWSSYVVSKTLDTAHLPRLTDEEKEMQKRQKKEQAAADKRFDSLKKVANEQPPEELDSIGLEAKKIQDETRKKDAENMRISDSLHPEKMKAQEEFMRDYKTSVTLLYDSADSGIEQGIIDFTTICDMQLYNDTLFISAGVGFMAGETVQIKIYKNQFTASFGLSEDDMMILKKNLSDTSYRDVLEVASVHQELTFLSQPTFKKGEKLCGYLEADFEPYYRRFSGSRKAVKQICHAKIFFTGKFY